MPFMLPPRFPQNIVALVASVPLASIILFRGGGGGPKAPGGGVGGFHRPMFK
jgi:hypothetical protein